MNWKVLSSKHILTRPWMTVRVDEVELPNGHVIPEYYVFEYPDWVNVIAIAEDGRMVLVRQYRHGIGRVSYEIPAGVLEPSDASPLAGAQRELLEETGFGGGEWTELMQVSGNAAAYNNITRCYLAQGVRPLTTPNLDEGEDLNLSSSSGRRCAKCSCAESSSSLSWPHRSGSISPSHSPI